jgi:hypothetical protein
MEQNPKRNEDIDTRLLPDGYTVLVNSKTDWAHTITPIAGLVWELCDGINSIEQIKDLVIDMVEAADKELLKQQVDELLKEFEKAGLVVTEAQSPTTVVT